MNKQEIIVAYAERFEMTKKAAHEEIDRVMTFVTENLVNGETLKVAGFMELGTKMRNARNVRDISTGEVYQVPAKRAPYCKFGKTIKDCIKGE